MPSPTTSSFLRPDLGDTFEEFDLAAQAAGLIGPRVLPYFPVALQTANFGKIPIEELLQEVDTTRAPGSGYSRGEWKFVQDNYVCVERGHEEPLDDREVAIYSYLFDAERITADRARLQVLRDLENRIEAAVFNTTTWTGAPLTTSVGIEWSTAATATPITDVLTTKAKVRATCGMNPNSIIFSQKVMENLQLTSQVIERVKYWGGDDPKAVNMQAFAAMFQLEQVIVAGGSSVTNTADKGQSAVIADIWDDEFAMVAKIGMTQDIREPCIGRLFHWTGDGSSEGGTVEQYRDERVRSDILRVRMDYHAKIIYPEAGHLLQNITA